MRPLAVVAAGGATGAIARWAVGALADTAPGEFPWATLLVNLVGCAAIGVAAQRIARDSLLWLGLVVGLLGGLTTFSTFAVETEQLVDAGRAAAAVIYVGVSIGGGLLATLVAHRHRSEPAE